MSGLTTHVLDVAHGKPAQGMRIELHRLDGQAGLIGEAVTNADGRTGAPMLDGADCVAGRYELRFHVGDYFAASGLADGLLPFLDIVPVRFAIADPAAHYHVPLLVSPWSYSTYRGS